MRALLCDIGARAHDAGVYWKYGAWGTTQAPAVAC